MQNDNSQTTYIPYSGSPDMQKAERLERRFKDVLHGAGRGIDWLSEYRKWLDKEGIPSEENGWPSSQAYDETNIGNFITYQLMV